MGEVSVFIWNRLGNELTVLRQSSATVPLLFLNLLSRQNLPGVRALLGADLSAACMDTSSFV